MAAGVAGAGARPSEDLIERIAELLEVTYRSADLGNFDDPLDETVFILLSRQTQDPVYRRVFADLRSKYPRWQDVSNAPEADLQEILRPSGLFKQRVEQLKGLLQVVDATNEERSVGPYGRPERDLTLDFLNGMDDASAETFLESLPGIGEKSARCVLSYSLDRPAFAVDTHVRRIFLKLCLSESKGRKVDHDPFQDAVPPKLRKQLHINLVHHGRAVCTRKEPACSDCVLISFCDEGRKRAAAAADPESPVAVDLFAGAGGLSEGFEQEGFRIALAADADRHAAQTYRANHPGVPVVEMDVTKLTASKVRELAVGGEQIDAVIAGPPCQGYSAAGKRRPDDAKNVLFRHVVKLAKDLRAEFLVMENVPGLRRVNGQHFKERILNYIRSQGFSAGAELLNAQDFETPQRRSRYFFLAREKGAGPRPAKPPALTPVHEPGLLKKRFMELPQLGPAESAEYRRLEDGTYLINGSTMVHSPEVIEKISKVEAGKGPISYRRLDGDAARTLIAGHRALPVHPWLHRTISVREAACIQGFRDDYVFCGPRSEQPLQVANAVPPAVAAAVARSVWERLEEG